jgi:hypothetical protein
MRALKPLSTGPSGRSSSAIVIRRALLRALFNRERASASLSRAASAGWALVLGGTAAVAVASGLALASLAIE